MKIFNKRLKNEFDNLKQFKKNVIKVDDYFWNLNVSFKSYCICLI